MHDFGIAEIQTSPFPASVDALPETSIRILLKPPFAHRSRILCLPVIDVSLRVALLSAALRWMEAVDSSHHAHDLVQSPRFGDVQTLDYILVQLPVSRRDLESRLHNGREGLCSRLPGLANGVFESEALGVDPPTEKQCTSVKARMKGEREKVTRDPLRG